MSFQILCSLIFKLSNFIKEIFPFLNLVFMYAIARFITKNANLDIKKRELMFSVAKDFENRVESLFEKIKAILGDSSLDADKGRRIQIDLKVISNLFYIISSNLKQFLNEETYVEACINYNELRDLIADIEIFYKDNPGSAERDLINKYSKFIGSFVKLKFDLLKE
ncbi:MULTISPECIES: hypothetical protein [Leptospira]|uniref:Uncharacterized protein n=1 Tax=Leptospira santarosai str. ZUN179 TaxID=1049985 RepID=M6VCL0_9LEPT|nr:MULTISPECIES: hypothetical protein [Leptospira]EKO76834.1 hypothetical protein LEP1GSC068_0444 [Leptospira sp. Fiocruz LV3954]EMO47263.1 hypothetical protein LEP1GSC187_0019 [Leptospira santarosai str. ZUN179]MDI7191252.1 hypothetical protein [Leptospira santarosai]MDI7222737.1 hypothetical protein [Leptospira santarosai]